MSIHLQGGRVMEKKKEKEFWPIHLNCKKCKKELSIAEVAFSSDGRVCLVGRCPQCTEYTAVVDTWQNIMQYVYEKEGWGITSISDMVQ